MRMNSPFLVIALCIVWGAFAAAAVYVNSNGSMPSDEWWKFEIDPVGRLKPIDLFFEENPIRGTLKVALRPSVWLMDQKASGYRPHFFETDAYILPPGYMDILLETAPDQEKLAVRVSLSESFPSSVLYYKDSQVTHRIPMDLKKAGVPVYPPGEKILNAANKNRMLSQWEPRITQKVNVALLLGEKGMQVHVNELPIVSASYDYPPFRFGFSAMGVDFPVFIERIKAEFFLPGAPSSKTHFATDFGSKNLFLLALFLWAIFSGLFFLFSKGLGKLLTMGNSARGKREKERTHTAFWPVVFAPLFLWPGTFVSICLFILVLFWRLKKSVPNVNPKAVSVSKVLIVLAPILAAAMTFRQVSALYDISANLPIAIGLVFLVWFFWAIPFVVLIALSRFKKPEIIKLMVPLFSAGFIVQLFYLQTMPKGAYEAAVLVFGCFVLGAGLSVFMRQNIRRPNITLFILALLLWPTLEAAYYTGLIVDVPGERLPKEYKADKTLFWTLKERPVPFSKKKQPDEMRVISLGGSVTWGAGVLQKERTYPMVMQNELNRLDPARSWVVMNAGVPGYCSVQGLLSLQSHIDAAPDVVTVCFGVNEYNRSGFHSTLAQYRDRLNAGRNKTNSIGNALQRSFFYRLLRSTFIKRNSGVLIDALAAPNTHPEEFEKILEEIDDLCKKIGAKTVFLSEAHILQLLGPHEVDPYNERMRRLAKTRGVPLVDIQAILRKHKEDDLLLDTVHPTPYFHKLIGQATARKILYLQKD